jgi:hypothetical protein
LWRAEHSNLSEERYQAAREPSASTVERSSERLTRYQPVGCPVHGGSQWPFAQQAPNGPQEALAKLKNVEDETLGVQRFEDVIAFQPFT